MEDTARRAPDVLLRQPPARPYRAALNLPEPVEGLGKYREKVGGRVSRRYRGKGGEVRRLRIDYLL